MSNSQPLYRTVVEISEEYLGQAAERFIKRQISAHLKKDPADITPQDLDTLIHWIKLTFAMLTDNKEEVIDYESRLRDLSERTQQGASS